MSLKEEDRRIMVTLELDRVEKTIEEFELLAENGMWSLAGNRLYYTLFHAVSALLINDNHEVGTHRGAVNRFSLYYVKTGIFTAAEGRMYSLLQKLREDGEYNCYIDIEKEDVEGFVEPTRQLIEKIKRYINDKRINEN